MADTFTEVTYQSWGSRMSSSIGGVCIGVLLFFGSGGLLFWNEGRAVKRQADLDEGRGIYVDIGFVSSDSVIDTTKNGNLVYVFGELNSNNSTLYDELFGLDAADVGALKYHRISEMYQWKEESSSRTESTSGGGTKTVTEYSYRKVWSESLISSSSFKKSGYNNPSTLLVDGLYILAEDVSLGTYDLGNSILQDFNWYTDWYSPPVDESNIQFSGYTTTVFSDEVMIEKNPGTTQIGDTRVHFEVVLPDIVSIVAMQSYSVSDDTQSLVPYITEGGRELYLTSRGEKSAEALFQEAEDANTTLTWILRAVGFALMVLSITIVLAPLSVFFDVIPLCGNLIGDCVGGISCCISLIISIPVTLLVISIAWIFYRPIFAIGAAVMLVLLLVIFFFYIRPKLSKPTPANAPNQTIGNQPFNQGFQPEKPSQHNPYAPTPYSYQQQQQNNPYNEPEIPVYKPQEEEPEIPIYTAEGVHVDSNGNPPAQNPAYRKASEPAPFSQALNN